MATTGPIDLTVNINNINEACYFDKTYYYVTLAEATVGIDLLLLILPNQLYRDKERFTKSTQLQCHKPRGVKLRAIQGS